MKQNKRFQSRVTASRFTLPVAIVIATACWLLSSIFLPSKAIQGSGYPLWEHLCDLCIPLWIRPIAGYVLHALIGFFLIQLNNMFAIIRMQASLQTSIYFMLIAACPHIHTLYAGDVAAAAFLVALFFLFDSYQRTYPMVNLFYSFMCIGLGSLVFPQLTWLAPLFWIGAYMFQSLTFKSFLASLVGWIMPFWLLFAHAYFHEDMDLIHMPFRELVNFSPWQFSFEPWQLATLGYLLLLFIVSSVHCLMTVYEDKIRTRNYLQFLMLLSFCIFICVGLQPTLSVHLISLLLISICILIRHLFALSNTRISNIFFIASVVGLFLLFGFNLWTLL